jgi:ribosomal protein S18 acetylase RimI-like enzyme
MKFGGTDAHLFLLALDPKVCRRSIDKTLVHMLRKFSETDGLASTHLEVCATNLRAIKFYEQLDYARSSEITGHYNSREAAAVMGCSLSQIQLT